MKTSKEFTEQAVNAIRFLAVDGVQKARSGHPGLPMGTAAMAFTIWTRHLQHNPANPGWFDRDRFVLSGGHGSMLLYSLLYLTGYDLSLDELKNFRQWGSRTPGHPEVGVTPGVETTTGPLGQGFANGVGFAIAEAQLAATYNRPGHNLVDHFTYAIVTDGDLMEGVASEAASLAGHLQLGRLIYLYDDNRISIDGSTDLAFTEERGKRFEAYGWQVLHVADGNDVEAIDAAILAAKADPRPSLIVCRTHIGYGLPTRQDTSKAHGEPPGDEELDGAKRKLGWPLEPRFYVPEEVLAFFRQALADGKAREAEWQARLAGYRAAYPAQAAEFERRAAGKLPDGWEQALPVFAADGKGMATRAASGKVINALAGVLPELSGGSADLAPSNNTWITGPAAFQRDSRDGRNFHFGVREHGMAAVLNGMALHGGLMPYGATFLTFADYMRGAMRVAALSHVPVTWVFTHDSIGLGEDGPTHQPVEQLASLRILPNVLTLRPADANETAEAWRVAVEHRDGPTALVLTRQALPTLDRATFAPADGLRRGAYVLADLGGKDADILLMASGSEVSLALAAAQQLAAEGVAARVVSFPSWELFEAQDKTYRETVLPKKIRRRIAIEAGLPFGWERYVGEQGRVIAMHGFGASAPGELLFEKFGFSVAHVLEEARGLLGR